MTERDPLDDADLPLDELRRAWSRIKAPSPQDDLAQCDERTRAAVEWMRNAWSRVEVPEPVLPARSVRFRRAQRFVLPLAAAAGALVALGIWLALQRFAPGVRPEGVDQPIAEQAAPPRRSPEGASASFESGIELAALASDHVELRSGPVRLILLTAEPSSHNP